MSEDSNKKSKLPDFKEVTSMAGKLFHDMKKSVSEIIAEYKANHPNEPATEKPKAEKKPASEEPKTEKAPKEEPKAEDNEPPADK